MRPKKGTPTPWRTHRRGQVRERKEYDRADGTHFLETASGGISHNTERIRPGEWHSRTGDRIIREGQVKTRNDYDRASGTHELRTALRGTNQHVKIMR